MKISRVADEKLAPSWVFEDAESLPKFDYIEADELGAIETLPAKLSDTDVVDQRKKIELCAENGKLYHFNDSWSDDEKSTLREYAMVCGMDMSKFKAVDPNYIKDLQNVQREASNSRIARLAGKGEEMSELKIDAFKLDEKSETEHMEKEVWEDVDKQINLKDKPSMMLNTIKPVRGGENYFENSDIAVANGQNSISDPNAIKNYAESVVEDTGERLRRENQAKEAQKELNHRAWEQDKMDAMDGSEIIPKGSVFQTEALDAQTGIGTLASDRANINADDIPELTPGEQLAQKSEAHRKSIQGEEKESHEFELKSSSVRGISDTFAEELKKFVK